MKTMDLKIEKCVRAYWLLLMVSIGWIAVVAPCFAQKKDTAFRDLARKMQNPITERLSFSFEGDMNFGVGRNEDTQSIFKIRSLKAFNLGDKWNLITRPIIPLVRQPELIPGTGDEFGLGDISLAMFLMPRSSRLAIVGFGPVVAFPSASDKTLGLGKWRVGPALALVSMPGPWIFGVVANNLWSVGGNSNRADVNTLSVQPLVYYNFTNGWYLFSEPTISAAWTKRHNDRWTVPLGGGGGKLFMIGDQQMNASLQAFYNVEQTALDGDWSLRVNFQLLFPD